jgi:hypothetical protein
MALWLASPSSGTARTAPGLQTPPVSPCLKIIQRIPAADSKRKTGGPEGPPFTWPIQPAEVRPERVTLSPFVPKEHLSIVASYGKPGNACGPRTNGPAAIRFMPQPGLMDRKGHPPGGELTAEPPMVSEPQMQRDAWRPRMLKPSDPAPSQLASIPFEPQTGGSAEIRRPKQALRELVLPSPRPWYSLTIPWQSFLGFHLALPPAEAASETTVQAMHPAALWNSTNDMHLRGRRSLQELKEIPWRHAPSPNGVRTKIPAVEPIAVVAPLSPGLNRAFQGGKPSGADPKPFTKIVGETLPLPHSVVTPAPIVALSTGLSIWTGTINSYTQRTWCSPRLREGGRAVHMLRLAPSIQVKEECKISAA